MSQIYHLVTSANDHFCIHTSEVCHCCSWLVSHFLSHSPGSCAVPVFWSLPGGEKNFPRFARFGVDGLAQPENLSTLVFLSPIPSLHTHPLTLIKIWHGSRQCKVNFKPLISVRKCPLHPARNWLPSPGWGERRISQLCHINLSWHCFCAWRQLFKFRCLVYDLSDIGMLPMRQLSTFLAFLALMKLFCVWTLQL